MRLKDIQTEEKVRLDPKCWTGKKIGNPKTKVKGGVRVNNCVPAESVNEMDKSQTPPGRDGSNDSDAGKKEYTAKATTPKKVAKDAEKILNKELNKKKGMAEGLPQTLRKVVPGHAKREIDKKMDAGKFGKTDADKDANFQRYKKIQDKIKEQGVAETMATFSAKASTGNSGSGEFRGVSIPSDMKHPEWREPTWSFQEIAQKLGIPVSALNLIAFNRIGGFPEALPGLSARHGSKKYYKQSEVKRWVNANNVREKLKQGVAEGDEDSSDKHYYLRNNIWRVMDGDEVVDEYTPARYEVVGAKKLLAQYDDDNIDVTHVISPMGTVTYLYGKPEDDMDKNMAEGYNPEYDDEAGMAQGSLHTLQNAVEGLQQVIDAGDNLPEWCQEKISLAEDYLVTVWDYIQSEKAQGVDPEIEEMYEAMDQLAEEMAAKKGVSADLVWETFEALDDNMLYETAAWRRKEGKSKSGGLNAKGVASYRRENPGSKLQTAVTTKPSKLKPGSKAAKRRKSFCARMSGVKGPMKKPNGKPTRKALALRKWNC